MTEHGHLNPFSYRQGHVKIIASGDTDTQIARMPWQTPIQKPGILRKLTITNNLSNGGLLKIWDQDLSSTTPPVAGSAGGALITVEIGASGSGTTTELIEEKLPELYFVGGIASQATVAAVTVMAEVEYI